MADEQIRVIVFQPVLPAYRLDFFDRVEREAGIELIVRFPPTSMDVLTEWSGEHAWARATGALRPLFPGAEWQSGVLATPLRRGDVVVVYGSPRNISNMLMLAWARLRGARTVWWGHYWTSTTKHHRLLLRMLLMRLSHSVLFYTDQEIADYHRRHRRPDKRPIFALNNGINVEPIVSLREGYDARLRPSAILFVGRLTQKADLPMMLGALADPRLGETTLEVVGSGPEGPSLRALADSLGLADRVTWHGGTINEAEIAGVANRCRIFAYPGAVGLSLIHAMAYGLPAVVHNERWRQMPEIAAFADGVTGRAFNFGETGSLADALASALNDFDALNRWSKEAARRAETTYNTKAMAKRFAELISTLSRSP